MTAQVRSLSLAIVALCTACGESNSTDMDLARRIENEVMSCRPDLNLDEYARYYVRGPEDNVTGVYLFSNEALEHLMGKRGLSQWVSDDAIPKVDDGGCSVLNVRYHEPTETLVYASCNPDA